MSVCSYCQGLKHLLNEDENGRRREEECSACYGSGLKVSLSRLSQIERRASEDGKRAMDAAVAALERSLERQKKRFG